MIVERSTEVARHAPAGPGPSPRTAVRMWPWVTAVVATAAVILIIGALRHFNFRGIDGFSTLNYGWLAGALAGGLVFGWRLAGYRQSLLGLIRPVVAAAVSYALCFVLVTITGLVFLPGQSLAETVTTDAPGRSLPVAIAVLVGSCAMEIIRAAVRSIRRR